MKPNDTLATTSITPLYLQWIRLALVAALLPLLSTGCNTTRGFGKDVEKTGEGIQNITK